MQFTEVKGMLEKLRKSRDLTQVQLAKKLKAEQGSVSRWELAEDIKFGIVKRVAKALGYKVSIEFTEEKKAKA
jgi:transcriptional regulator with XRE-family HTH domain